MRVLLLVHSRTGTTARVAADLAARLGKLGATVEIEKIEPVGWLPYLAWLALSFIPGLPWPVKKTSDPAKFDRLIVAFPKWTFNHPVITELLNRLGGNLPPTALLVTCGGWDQERYLAAYVRKVKASGVSIPGTLAVRKKAVGDARYEAAMDNLARSIAGRG